MGTPITKTQVLAYLMDKEPPLYAQLLNESDFLIVGNLPTVALCFYSKSKLHVRLDVLTLDGRFSLANVCFFIKHELCHYLLGHLTGRHLQYLQANPKTTNIGADIAIHEVLYLPHELKNVLHTADGHKFERNKITEVYIKLLMNQSKKKSGMCSCMSGMGQNNPWAPWVNRSPWQDIDVENCDDSLTEEGLHEHYEYLKKRAGSVPQELERAINAQRSVKFARFLNRIYSLADSTGGKGISRTWSRLNKRNPAFRGYVKRKRPPIAIILDTSGSISGDMLNRLAGALSSISSYCKAFVVVCDADVHEMFWFNGRLQKVSGGGGTVFNPAFERIEAMNFQAVAILTDGFCSYPETTTIKNVVWGVIDNPNANFRFGEIIELRK